MNEIIYLVIGFGFGCVIMLNQKEYRQQKTYEQLDEELRKELAVNKNLVKSLTEDLHWAKQRIEFLKGKQQ
jgi:hypothetical protein